MHLLSRVLLVLAIFISTSNAYWETTNIQHYPYEQGEPHLPLATPLDVLRRRLREFIKPNAQTVPCLVFWTGNYTIHTDPLDLTSPVVELSVRYQAARIAQHFLSTPARPCRTLEMSLDVVTDARRRKIYLPGPQQRDARAGKVWRWLSYDVADLVEHETHLVVGTKIRIGNVWERIEYPRIRARAQIAPSIHKYQWTFGTNIPGIQAQIRPTTFRVVPLNHQKRSMTEQDVKVSLWHRRLARPLMKGSPAYSHLEHYARTATQGKLPRETCDCISLTK